MYFFQFIFMCIYIAIYLYFELTGTPFPPVLRTINMGVCWLFLLWAGYIAGKVIIDCIVSNARNQMSTVNMYRGILLVTLQFIPTLLMSLFLLKEGFVSK